MELGNSEDLAYVVLKTKNLKLKNARCTPTWGALSGAFNCLMVFHNLFFSF